MYIVQEIANLADAIDFLNDWPEDQQDWFTWPRSGRAWTHAMGRNL
ncbi:hypothetical protein ACWGS9_31720 [Bradyrhizobium sp. Arg314]